jgi:hypothetical protein
MYVKSVISPDNPESSVGEGVGSGVGGIVGGGVGLNQNENECKIELSK